MPDTLLILLDTLKLQDGGIVIAAAMEMYTIYRVQGDSSHLYLGLLEEAVFRQGLYGWAGVRFDMMVSK